MLDTKTTHNDVWISDNGCLDYEANWKMAKRWWKIAERQPAYIFVRHFWGFCGLFRIIWIFGPLISQNVNEVEFKHVFYLLI